MGVQSPSTLPTVVTCTSRVGVQWVVYVKLRQHAISHDEQELLLLASTNL